MDEGVLVHSEALALEVVKDGTYMAWDLKRRAIACTAHSTQK